MLTAYLTGVCVEIKKVNVKDKLKAQACVNYPPSLTEG